MRHRNTCTHTDSRNETQAHLLRQRERQCRRLMTCLLLIRRSHLSRIHPFGTISPPSRILSSSSSPDSVLRSVAESDLSVGALVSASRARVTGIGGDLFRTCAVPARNTLQLASGNWMQTVQ